MQTHPEHGPAGFVVQGRGVCQFLQDLNGKRLGTDVWITYVGEVEMFGNRLICPEDFGDNIRRDVLVHQEPGQ